MSLNHEPPPPAVCRLLKCIWTDAMAELLPGLALRATTPDKVRLFGVMLCTIANHLSLWINYSLYLYATVGNYIDA